MTMSIMRFDMRTPGLDPAATSSRYGAALEMAAWADRAGFDMLVLSEHHGAEDGYLPSPMVMAGAVAAVTDQVMINVSALLVPLHNPVRLAEDVAVVDLISNGRISFVAGIGYRPIEYEALGIPWAGRGQRMDAALEVLLKAWRGEEFEWEGGTYRVTPLPVQRPPMVFIGGSGPKAAKRAARFGLGLFPSVPDQELLDRYEAECRALGNEPGWCMAPSADQPGMVIVADDPDKAWAEAGPFLLRDAMTYKSWQTADTNSMVQSAATTIEELRAEGVYQVLTPDEVVALAGLLGNLGGIVLHPLCGGLPPEMAWPSLELFADKVLPRIKPS